MALIPANSPEAWMQQVDQPQLENEQADEQAAGCIMFPDYESLRVPKNSPK